MIKNLNSFIYRIVASLIWICLLGCNKLSHNDQIDNRIYIKDVLKLTFPKGWYIDKDDAIDSYRYMIFLNKEKDKHLILEVGYYCNNLSEQYPDLIGDSSYFEILKRTPEFELNKYVLISKNDYKDPDLYRSQNIRFDTIADRFCKITYPINIGKGITGIHFYKISDETKGIGNLRLNITGENLSKEEMNTFFKLVDEITFLNNCKTCLKR